MHSCSWYTHTSLQGAWPGARLEPRGSKFRHKLLGAHTAEMKENNYTKCRRWKRGGEFKRVSFHEGALGSGECCAGEFARENATPDEREEREGQKEEVQDAERQALRCTRVTELSATQPSGRCNLKTQKPKIELVFMFLPSFSMQITQ